MFIWDLTESSHDVGKKTILPLSSGHLNKTVELISVGYLGVDILAGSLSADLVLGLSKSLPC
jgi:hypothetical protein